MIHIHVCSDRLVLTIFRPNALLTRHRFCSVTRKYLKFIKSINNVLKTLHNDKDVTLFSPLRFYHATWQMLLKITVERKFTDQMLL